EFAASRFGDWLGLGPGPMGTSRLPHAWAAIRTTTKNRCNQFASAGVCGGGHFTDRHHRWPGTGAANLALGPTECAQAGQQPGHNPAAVESLSPLAGRHADGAGSCLAGRRWSLDKKFLETSGRYSWLSIGKCFERGSFPELWRLPCQRTPVVAFSASDREARRVTRSHFSRRDFSSALWGADPAATVQYQRTVASHSQERSSCGLSRCHTVVLRDVAYPSEKGPRVRRTRHCGDAPCSGHQ